MKSLVFTGGALAFMHHEEGHFILSLGVRCRFGNYPRRMMALLDTGASRSVLGGDLAGLLQDDLSSCGGDERISTRLGTFVGQPHRLMLHLLADSNQGRDIALESTFLVIPDWQGPVVLGMSGCLEHIKFAFEPHVQSSEIFLWWGLPS